MKKDLLSSGYQILAIIGIGLIALSLGSVLGACAKTEAPTASSEVWIDPSSDDYEDVDPSQMVGIFIDTVCEHGVKTQLRVDVEPALSWVEHRYSPGEKDRCYLILWCYHCGLGGKYIKQYVPCDNRRTGVRPTRNPGGNKVAVPDSSR